MHVKAWLKERSITNEKNPLYTCIFYRASHVLKRSKMHHKSWEALYALIHRYYIMQAQFDAMTTTGKRRYIRNVPHLMRFRSSLIGVNGIVLTRQGE